MDSPAFGSFVRSDMIDTAGTLCKAAAELKNFGARSVYAFASHGLLNGPAAERIRDSGVNSSHINGSLTSPRIMDSLAGLTHLRLVRPLSY